MQDLCPTIDADSVVLDDVWGSLVFVDDLTPGTLMGGIVDPESGAIVGTIGLTDPDSGEFMEMVSLMWSAAFGFADMINFGEVIPAERINELEEGDSILATHNGLEVLLELVPGANPGDGLMFLTISEPGSGWADHLHICKPVLSLALENE